MQHIPLGNVPEHHQPFKAVVRFHLLAPADGALSVVGMRATILLAPQALIEGFCGRRQAKMGGSTLPWKTATLSSGAHGSRYIKSCQDLSRGKSLGGPLLARKSYWGGQGGMAGPGHSGHSRDRS